ncbi:sigma-70 family RNA polymerase sigma factor [Streptomyces tubercidicus]|uniref:sigma-70 family RNA polymerase sigma factor n=1 Tax=Streptomyces tubercidicus TaxID=47759 RepID=UPI00367911E3
MSDRPATPHPTTKVSDAHLIASTRAGDCAAYEELYSRHRKAAAAYARRFASCEVDIDDLVAEAFTNVLNVLRKGAGPNEFFRAYLLRSIKHYACRNARQQQRTVLTDMWDSLDLAEPLRDSATEAFDHHAVSAAFKSLPERWQAVLWHSEVEGEAPTTIGRLLGLRPNSVSALAYRAREGLRIAYIQAHITTMSDEACRKHAAKLGAYTRGKLAPGETTAMRGHLNDCERCKSLYLELTDVASAIRAVIAPLLLGPPMANYLLHTQGPAAQAAHLPRIPHEAKWTSGKVLIGKATAGVMLGAGALTLTFSGTHQTAVPRASGTVAQPWIPLTARAPGAPSPVPALSLPHPAADVPMTMVAESSKATPAHPAAVSDGPAPSSSSSSSSSSASSASAPPSHNAAPKATPSASGAPAPHHTPTASASTVPTASTRASPAAQANRSRAQALPSAPPSTTQWTWEKNSLRSTTETRRTTTSSTSTPRSGTPVQTSHTDVTSRTERHEATHTRGTMTR